MNVILGSRRETLNKFWRLFSFILGFKEFIRDRPFIHADICWILSKYTLKIIAFNPLSRAIFIVKNCACKFPTHSVKNPDVFIRHTYHFYKLLSAKLLVD